MKTKPKGAKRAARANTRADRLSPDPTERDAKDFIVAAIQKSLGETLEQLGFSSREVKGLLEGPTRALTAAVREKLRSREVKK